MMEQVFFFSINFHFFILISLLFSKLANAAKIVERNSSLSVKIRKKYSVDAFQFFGIEKKNKTEECIIN